MAFVTDTFTDTDGTAISSHTGELGATWTALTGNADTPTIQSNALDPGTGSSANGLWYASGSPASADYSASLIAHNNNGSSAIVGPAVRCSTSAQTGYFALLIPTTSVALYKYVAGSLTSIASVSTSFSNTVDYTCTLTVSGTTLTVRVQRSSDSQYLNSGGSWQAGATDCISTTDSAISAAGKAGLWLSQVAANPSTILSFSAADPGDTTPPTLSSPSGTGGAGVCSGSVSTNEGNGTLYAVVTGSATAPSAAQVKAGQDHTGAAALRVVSQAVSGTGTQSIGSGSCSTGTRYMHFMHEDASANQSAVVSSASFTVTSSPATAITMSGPSSGTVGVASTNFTIGADGTITGTITVTPSDSGAGGTFAPTSVSISSGTPTATFTYTAASAGAKTISETNDGGLTDASNITYTASNPTIYTRVDATDTIGGQDIMVLVPNSFSANPYDSGTPTGVILYCHGNGEDETALLSDALKSACVTALLDAGYILAGSNAHGSNWGSQTAVDDYGGLEKYVRDNYNVSNVALWSQSMGGLTGLQYLAQHKSYIVGWLGTYPVCNLANLYSLGVYTTTINSSFGITGSGNATYANLTRGHDPALLTAVAYGHCPMRFYASSGDTVVPKTDNTDVLAAHVAGTCRESTVISCTGNHGDPSHFQAADYVDFFDRCFATPVANSGQLGGAVSVRGRLVNGA